MGRRGIGLMIVALALIVVDARYRQLDVTAESARVSIHK
ncbi:hypothetical protein SAMN04515671_4526 [Nakamurella panacisegetis]|uniref:Uncharacterized protein n=1 Tax=Nakamurella panacisegetis TaxID=1090615 RepID=A0A1H0T8E5_9ACTN|nr:hypothetical protein SAMN04515671_4526 [Nakamurella panacisegetis]